MQIFVAAIVRWRWLCWWWRQWKSYLVLQVAKDTSAVYYKLHNATYSSLASHSVLSSDENLLSRMDACTTWSFNRPRPTRYNSQFHVSWLQSSWTLLLCGLHLSRIKTYIVNISMTSVMQQCAKMLQALPFHILCRCAGEPGNKANIMWALYEL